MIWTVEDLRQIDRSDVALCRLLGWSYEDLMRLPLRVYDAALALVDETSQRGD